MGRARGEDVAESGQPPGGMRGALYVPGPLGTPDFPGALGRSSQRRPPPPAASLLSWQMCLFSFIQLTGAEDFSYLLPFNELI